jgi:hypothetical protein
LSRPSDQNDTIAMPLDAACDSTDRLRSVD